MKYIQVVICVWLAFTVGVIDSHAQTSESPEYSVHVVQRGENLFRIAMRYEMTTLELAQLNGIDNPASIQVGQRLLISAAPIEMAALPATPQDAVGVTATPAAVVGSEEPLPTAEDAVASSEEGTQAIHVVQRGETLFRIATSYGTTVSEVVAANNLLDPTRIFAGQRLVIPNVELPKLDIELPNGVDAISALPQIFTEGRTGQIQVETSSASVVQGTFRGQSLVSVPNENDTRHWLLVGVPMFTEPGEYPLELTVQVGEQVDRLNINMPVMGGVYGSERINLIADRNDLLNENVEQAEAELLQQVTSSITPQSYLDGPLGLPAAAAITSGFGTRRSYNGGAFDRFHSGTDFAGAPGTAILAPAAGRVVMADTLNVRGNATMIDHGWGVYTGYWHQTEMYVAPGDIVETGQVIGTIGSTGRVTGAHLHWELWVNGVAVDPMQWVQRSFLGGGL